MLTTLRSLYVAPRVADAPGPIWRDWLLVAVFVPVALVEAVLRTDLVWPVPSAVICVGAILLLPLRRVRPLAIVLVVFGAINTVDVFAFAADVPWEGANTTAVVLLLPYSLLRWGSGRDAAIGLPVMLLSAVATVVTDDNPIGDTVGGALVLLFASALGALVRYEGAARERHLEQAKSQEREELARELHDTVAHHVSAIAIRAQAGLAMADRHETAAVDALRVIEEEASLTLAEMRVMVGVLRRGGEPELSPLPGVADVGKLAAVDVGLEIDISLSGDLHGLRPAVDAAVFRLAQESVTNAIRHARHATRVDVEVVGAGDHIRLTVADDGRGSSSVLTADGFGLVGMRERVTLLGGSIDAGPTPLGGWTVVAVLPRDGGST